MWEKVLFAATVTSSWSLVWASQSSSFHSTIRYEEELEPGYTDFTVDLTSERHNRANNMYERNEEGSQNDAERRNGPQNSGDVASLVNDVLLGFNRRLHHRTPSEGRSRRNRKKTRRNFDRKARWPPKSSGKRRGDKPFRKRYNKGNRTYGRPPKRTLKNGSGQRNPRRKSNIHNGHPGRSAGQRYRSLDPERAKVRRHLVMQHNHLRAKVVPNAADMLAVEWYDTAAEQAKTWAEQCDPHTEADHPSVRWTSRYGACGQNVLVSTTKKRWSQVIGRWWSGRRHFRYGGNNLNSSAISAYTQMAWYSSHQLGCGFAQCSTPGGATFFRYVCNYCPAGNDPSRLNRPYTRGEICSECPGSCKSVCHRRRCNLCTNACSYSDLWINCATLNKEWHEWLCNTKTKQGVERFKNCRATCQCVKEIT